MANDKRSQQARPTRPQRLPQGAPMEYAPENEQGVVFLFAYLARKWRLRIDRLKVSFADCIAYQATESGDKRVRIEFEYQSRNFKTQGHNSKGCDWIVCWKHDWPAVPMRLRVVELLKEYGLGFNVWIQPVREKQGDPKFKDLISREISDSRWSVPSKATQGDLILRYLTRPDACIHDICRLTGQVEQVRADWKPGMDYMGSIRRVCQLKSPIFLEDMQGDRILKTAPFVRAQMQGRPCGTEYWPYLYDLIIRRNPSVRNKLARFDPQRLP